MPDLSSLLIERWKEVAGDEGRREKSNGPRTEGQLISAQMQRERVKTISRLAEVQSFLRVTLLLAAI